MSGVEISIIVPVYNGEKYLKECIESILKQSFMEWELIFIDDGSVDKSQSIIEGYISLDSRIRYYWKKNGGVSSARNLGIRNALGKYVMFVDCDDTIHAEMCAVLYDMMEKEICDMAACSLVYCLYEQNKLWKKKRQQIVARKICSIEEFGNTFEYYFDNKIYLSVWGKLYRRDLIHRGSIFFPEELSIGEDLLFNLMYFETGHKISVVNICGYQYRLSKTEDSLSSMIDNERKKKAMYIYQKSMEYVKKMGIEKQTEKTLMKYYFRSCFMQLEKQSCFDKTALDYFDENIRKVALKIPIHKDMEFLIYKLICKIHTITMIKVVVILRKLIRKIVRG